MSPRSAGAGDPLGYPGIIRALSHPLRAQILGVLQERRASPRELADEFGASLSTVAYHVRVLADLKLIRLVKKTPRRGAIEHHYEAVAAAQISGELWATVPTIAKQALASAALGEIGRAVNSAAALGGFDREDVHLTRSRLMLDELGWGELATELAGVLERAERIEERSRKRLRSGDHEGELRAALVMMLFEDPSQLGAAPAEGKPGDHGCRGSGRRADIANGV